MQVHAYKDIWNAGLLLFAFHLIVLGLLAWKASYTPTFLGALLFLAGLGYVIDAFGTVLFAGYKANVATFYLSRRGRADRLATRQSPSSIVKGRRFTVSSMRHRNTRTSQKRGERSRRRFARSRRR